jgi:hypothetical protein
MIAVGKAGTANERDEVVQKRDLGAAKVKAFPAIL